jgi:hypothetical protein
MHNNNKKQTARERWNWANLETEGIMIKEGVVHKQHPVVIMLKHDNVIGHNNINRNADGQLMLYKVDPTVLQRYCQRLRQTAYADSPFYIVDDQHKKRTK